MAINVPFYCQTMIIADYIYIIGQSILGLQYRTQQYTQMTIKDDRIWNHQLEVNKVSIKEAEKGGSLMLETQKWNQCLQNVPHV